MSDPQLAIAALDGEVIARRLAAVRERTLALVDVLPWETLRRQHIPILSPMVWDLGHVANFEEIWLIQRLADLEPVEDGYASMFDAVLNPRPRREALPLPGPDRLHAYLWEVRRRTLEVLAALEPSREPRLIENGLVFEMVAEHEEQHQETLLQAMQTLAEPACRPATRRPVPEGRDLADEMVEIPGGPFEMGHPDQGFSYDNERKRHRTQTGDFLIDRTPVTTGKYRTFIEGGGYERRELWSDAGWYWRQETGARCPGNWIQESGRWHVRYMDRYLPLPEDRPVIHVSYHEAEAYARFVGKRLPTESEWEKAALWDPAAARARSYPWGEDPPSTERANLDQLAFEPAPVGAYPQGVSAYGVHQMVGDVWEWTSSDFLPYPGFEAYPYSDYSEVFFGSDYKVLRGGSWATRPAVARGTSRNWDYPIRRQIFAGFRCASDPG